MMRRILTVAVVAAFAAAATTPLTAHAGVAGELDAFAEALDDLASATQHLAGTLSGITPGGEEHVGGMVDEAGGDPLPTASLTAGLGDLRVATVRAAAAGVPVADHLAGGRLDARAIREALDGPVRSLAGGIHELGVVSGPVTTHLWGRPVGTTAAATGELLAPAMQALAATLDTLAPALEALAPVVEPLAPVIGPACGQVPGLAFLALGLAPVLVPVPLPSLPASPAVLAGSVLAPAFLLCAALPMPAAETPEPDDGPGTAEPPVFDADAPPPAAAAPGERAVPAPSPRRGGAASFASPAAGARSPSEVAAPGPSSSADTALASAPARLTQLPLLPVDHDGEATSIALLVLLVAGAAAATTFFARRRAAAPPDWSVPGAAAAGVGALAAGAMAWSGAAEQVAPWAQLPYLISGGMTAVVLGLVAATLALARPITRLARERD